MRIFINEALGKDELVIEHGETTLQWGMFKPPQGWWKKADADATDSESDNYLGSRSERIGQLLFDINGYWASKSEEWQSDAFDCYYRILKVIDNTRDGASLSPALVPLVAELMDVYHDLDDVADYMQDVKLVYPPSVPEFFDSAQGRHHRVLTYTKKEYFGLACLTVALRAMLPVWTGYRAALPKDMERSRVYIELEILRTLRNSRMSEHEYMQRLGEYVGGVYNTIDHSSEISSIVNGICTEEIPNYLFASAICNKLTTTMLNAPADSNTSLVTAMYTKVKQDAQHLADKLGTKVLIRSDNRMGEDDDKIGYFESFSARQRVANDIIIGNQVYLYRQQKVRQDLDPDIPKALVATCLDSFIKMGKDVPILGGDNRLPLHQTLVQWVLSPIVMPRAIPNINRKAMLRAMAVTQAALFTWGFKELALLLSTRVRDDDEFQPVEILQFTGKGKQALDSQYQFSRPMDTSTGKTKNARPVSGGYASVESYADLLVSVPLEIVATDELKLALQYNEKIPVVAPNVRYSLAELLILINKKKIERSKEH